MLIDLSAIRYFYINGKLVFVCGESGKVCIRDEWMEDSTADFSGKQI